MSWTGLRMHFMNERIARCCVAAMLASTPALAQDPSSQSPGSARLTFEVASIKRKAEPVSGGSVRLRPGGRYERISATISDLIQLPYPTTRGDSGGAPDWVFTDRYDVVASAGRDATIDEISLMMRSLLEDRLQIRAQTVTEEQPIWHLVVARADGRLGPDLKPFPFECGEPGAPACGLSASREAVRAAGVPVSRIASFLRSSAGRQIVDKSGLLGNYQFTLVYRPETGREPDPEDARPNVFTALQEQLGLKLESARGPVTYVRVERIERPTPN